MSQPQVTPILLYNDECAVCRRLAAWVQASARTAQGKISILLRPIGDDPGALALLHPPVDIWDAYATIHLLMPDGSVKVGGEAVAEVLRDLPGTAWFAWTFALELAGVRPFQALLNGGYEILSDIRPLLGCESCGSSNAGVRAIQRYAAQLTARLRPDRRPHPPIAATRRRPPRAQAPTH